MRLLIVTQKVDKNDPILGFFHRWLEEFSLHCEEVDVITPFEGEHELPSNVSVLSLRKEHGASTISQIIRFWRLLRWRTKDCDAVLVHMTPIWAVLAWPILAMRGIPLYIWYEARGARWPLRVSLRLVRKIFSASKSGMPIATKKSVIVGHGIDTDAFSPEASQRDPHLVLSVGRITESKRLPMIIDAFAVLPEQYTLRIAGIPITSADKTLLSDLQGQLHAHQIEKRTEIGSASQQQVMELMRNAMIFLHASTTSLDKALLEAMSSGCLVLSCADAAKDVLPQAALATRENFAVRAKELLNMPSHEQDALRHELRQIVVQNHGLSRLIRRLIEEMRVS